MIFGHISCLWLTPVYLHFMLSIKRRYKYSEISYTQRKTCICHKFIPIHQIVYGKNAIYVKEHERKNLICSITTSSCLPFILLVPCYSFSMTHRALDIMAILGYQLMFFNETALKGICTQFQYYCYITPF